MKWCSSIAIIALLILIFSLCVVNKREGFTIHERNGMLCAPFLKGLDAHLMPSSVVFVVQGYNYQDTPKVYRDGRLVTPLQYAWDYGNMAYYLAIHAPEGLCGSEWLLETTDFVEPVVYEGRSEKKLNVSLVRRRDGYHRWMLSC